MRYFKHNKTKKFLFIDDSNPFWFETFIFNLVSNKIKSDYEYTEKDNKKEIAKKLSTYITKYEKKNFEALEIPQEVKDKTDAFCKNIEIEKVYYFHLEDKKEIKAQKLATLKIGNDYSGNGEFRLYRFQSDNYGTTELPTIKNLLDSSIFMGFEKCEEHTLLNSLKMILYMYYTMGFELIEKQKIYEKVAGNTIDLEQEYDSPLYLFKEKLFNKDNYVNLNYFEDDLLILTRSFIVANEKITEIENSPSFYTTKEEFKDAIEVKEGFLESDYYTKIELSKADFLTKYPIETSAKTYFKHPEAVAFNPPRVALETVTGAIDFDIKEFWATLINVNRLYFYVNEEGDNPLEWKVAFIIAKNIKKSIYIATKVFTLKDFNKIYEQAEEEELKYSSDIKDFFNKKAKAYKKAKLKPYDSAKVFEILTHKNLTELNKQKPVLEFNYQGNYFKHVVTCYENYADIWIAGNDKRHYLQFFEDTVAREDWLKNKDIENNVLFFPKEANYIEGFLTQIKTEEDTYLLKQSLSSENNSFSKVLKSQYKRQNLFKTDFEIIEGDWEVNGDLMLARKKSLLIKGNLKVSGSLLITDNEDTLSTNNPFIIIKGNVSANNFLLDRGFDYLQIEGDCFIKNITANSYTKNKASFDVGGLAKTDVLLHNHKNASVFKSYFDFNKEVNPFSNAVLEKSIYTKDSWDYNKVDFQVLFNFLKEDKKILTDSIEETKVDLDEYYQLQFERRMKDWGYFYPEYAGCKQLEIYEDNEIKGSAILPGAGDWVVNDVRGKSGTYGVSHEDYSICSLKVKKPNEFGIDYKQKPLKLLVSAEELMKRYINISMLYMDWAHRKTVAFGIENTAETYEKEKEAFIEDPHLALYWLNHFGATLDKRYNEVVKLIEDHKLTEKLELLKEPLAFFKKTDAFYNLEIGRNDKNEFKDLFLIRRAYLIYHEQVYKNYNPANLDLWWKSVIIYPKVEENLIVRLRWLKNNLNKCNKWSDFDALITEKDKNTPLLSYIFACNPNTATKKKTDYANTLISELIEHKNHFKTPHKKQFVEIILWDVKDFVSTKEKLKEASKFYFQGNETCKEYQDIQAVLGETNENIDEVINALEKLNKAFKGYDRFNTPQKEKQKHHQKVITIFNNLEPAIVLEVAQNIQNHELAKRCFVYLWHANIPNKKEALIRLFIHIELSGHDVSEEIFGKDFAKLITGDDDTNLEIAKALLTIPEANFRNDSMWRNSKEAVTKFFLTVAHQPNIFSFLIETVKQAPSEENEHIINAIYTTLFSTEYDSTINPVLKFSKAQVETMLETICNWFLKYEYHPEAYRSIYYCSNPMAEEWITKHMNDEKWLKQFAHISSSYDPLDEELKDAFVSALEFIEDEKKKIPTVLKDENLDNIEDEKQHIYLEFKDEKSHKFWEINFYDKKYIVTYGKVDTKGRTSEKEFDTDEACLKAGEKLIAQKIKKGYVKKGN